MKILLYRMNMIKSLNHQILTLHSTGKNLNNLSLLFSSLCTKDCISGPAVRNASVLKIAYAVCAFKNLWQIGHMV